MSDYAPKPWERPGSYMGATWEGWLVFLSQNRDSDCLTRCNFQVAIEVLKATNTDHPSEDTRTVLVVRESHWACGWIEWIAIHPSNVAAVQLASDMARELESYPVLDENRWSDLECDEACENWCHYDVEQTLRDAGVSGSTIASLPSMDRDAAAFIRETWSGDGADYETLDEGGCSFRFSDVGRDRAAWAIRWLRSTA